MDAETQKIMALTRIYDALHKGDLPCMKGHLKDALKDGFDPNLGSMLIHAASDGHLDIVKYVLQHDLAQRNVKDLEISKSCALTLSVFEERDEVVKYLIDLGITCPNLKTKYQSCRNAFNKKVTAQQQAHLLEENMACLKKAKPKHPSVRRRPK